MWLQQRCACKDATPASPLRKIVTAKSRKRLDGAAATPANEITSEADEYARKEDVQARAKPTVMLPRALFDINRNVL